MLYAAECTEYHGPLLCCCCQPLYYEFNLGIPTKGPTPPFACRYRLRFTSIQLCETYVSFIQFSKHIAHVKLAACTGVFELQSIHCHYVFPDGISHYIYWSYIFKSLLVTFIGSIALHIMEAYDFIVAHFLAYQERHMHLGEYLEQDFFLGQAPAKRTSAYVGIGEVYDYGFLCAVFYRFLMLNKESFRHGIVLIRPEFLV